ncbi:MAG TPA: tRNA (adenosine(37)-N6)-dimethylallyltransferase MiaA [Candidatus Paceibacterota bacterium]|nr:tRNA (adenosine(37)-N6)-dimethylallyltransferase MiaA [Candidatus Paceibacterota bacterium]
MRLKPKILVIVGPTSSGKSELAVKLAKKLNGEVVSADSRQVYKGLNIGAGKITEAEMRGVSHHLLDVAHPSKQFSVAEYKRLAEKTIDKILDKGRLPIICGGTGFYIQAIVDNLVLPEVPPNPKLRNRLEQKSVSQLFSILKKLDSRRAGTIDKNNRRRLIRAIEIATAIGKVPKIKTKSKYSAQILGIKLKDDELKRRIRRRLNLRLKRGMIAEAKRLHENGLSWKRMDQLGLEYRYLSQYLQGKISKKEMTEKIYIENWHYAKRQMTWFKRDKRIDWIKNSKSDKLALKYCQ